MHANQANPIGAAPATSRAATFVVGALLVSLASGCRSASTEERNHWNSDSVGPRVAYHLLGYPGTQTGEYENYRDFQWQEKQDINLTLRRHFLNRNPENPSQPLDPNYGAERPPHSLADPVTYMHISSIATGLVVLGATGGSAFVPIPIDSLFGTLEEGGGEEFAEGFRGDGDRVSRHTRRVPPAPEDFRVKNADAPRRTFGN